MFGAFKTGDRVDDRFELQESVASGGSGRIFRAHDLHTGRPVALKVVFAEDETNQVRFGREAQVLATVSHPGVVRYVAHGQTSAGAHYLVMEWLDGDDLGAILSRRGSPTQDGLTGLTVHESGHESGHFDRFAASLLTLSEVLALGRQLAAALGALHGLGVVHRDVKPSNVFAVGGDLHRIKLLDFGTARLGRSPTSLTRTGAIVGTPSYMAPEQVDGDKTLTPAVDVWATGVLLFECLVGETPFKARTVVAVLTKIAIDDPPDLAELRPDLPPALVELVMRSLSKDPAERPADGRALLEALEAIATDAPSSAVASARLGHEAPSAITRAERRVHCILLAQRVRLGSEEIAQLQRLVSESGAALTHLPDESVLVTARSSALPTDQATRVARAGLALRERLPKLRIAMALGRAAGGQANLVGDAIARVVHSLRVATPGEIRVDPTVAEILDARFVVSREGPHLRLLHERETETPRTLLGRTSTWVGRRREMVTLEEIFEECVEEPVARVVLVTGPAGAGKSRLRDELTRSLRDHAQFELLLGQGDSVTAGSPFVMLGPAIRRHAGIHTGEAIESSRRKLRAHIGEHVGKADVEPVTQFLGELIGVPFPDDGHERLQAARKDPMLMGDAMQSAFVQWLRALASARPVVLVLDDLHWGDLPSVRYVDAALRALRDLPLMVFALARPEVSQKFPALWSERALQVITLDALSKSASRKLVRHMLGEDVDREVEALIVARAGGNAFYLEELIRAVATGAKDVLPDSILGMLQARFDELGEEAKRVLRAASVFGRVFWAEGVEALVGRGYASFSASDWLEELAKREIIAPRAEGRFPRRHELEFRHALVRDAAHALLTEDDRRLGHRLAGLWLEQEGETDPSVLAEHYLQSDEPARACSCIQRAAAQALEGNDLGAVVERAEQAIALGAHGESLGLLRSMQAVACYWQGDYARAQELGVRAVEELAPGSTEWYRTLGTTIVASARRGDYDSVERWFQAARGRAPAAAAGRDQIVCLCRGCFQLIFAGRLARADEILDAIAQQVQLEGGLDHLDPLTLAQVEHVRGVRAAHGGDVGRFLVHLEAAVAAFDRAGDRRNVSLERPTVGWCFAEVGMFERAEEILVEALALAEELGARQTITYAEVNLGYVLGHRDRPDEAVEMLTRAAATCAAVGNVRLEGWARTHISGIERRRGQVERAEAEAATAIGRLALSPGLRAWAMAERARAQVALGRTAEAVTTAREAMALLTELGSMLQGESSPPLALAEALTAAGDHPAAAAAIADAQARLEARAARLPRPQWRPSFLARPENARILALRPTPPDRPR